MYPINFIEPSPRHGRGETLQKTSALGPTKIGNATRHYRKLAIRSPSQHVIGNRTAKFKIVFFVLNFNDTASCKSFKNENKISLKSYHNQNEFVSNLNIINDLVEILIRSSLNKLSLFRH